MRLEKAQSPPNDLEQRLIAIARQSAWFMPALRAVRELGLTSWCIGAGAVRNLVWDDLHGFAAPSALPDVDVVYFDGSALDPRHELALERRLESLLADMPWQVKNQAAVHLWFERRFGHPTAPLASLRDAVASWPEYATCVGLALRADDSIEVIAPHGLEDLFGLVVRRNPRVSLETYRGRIADKRHTERWPKVRIVD